MNGWRAEVGIPAFVRIKPGALDRLGIYAARHAHRTVALIASEGLPAAFPARALAGLEAEGAQRVISIEAGEASFEAAARLFAGLPRDLDAVIGLGGGRALDVAKYAAFLAGKPMYAVPTSLSNDGFSAPQSSLTLEGAKRSLPAAMPFAVVVDTEVCRSAPRSLWLSGVGDLMAKVTAVRDWKIAYHAVGEPVDDFAALLSDATVSQFLASPEHDLEGLRLLATALMLNGIAMAVCGSSRPASGSEHLISHALDAVCGRPRLHGLQVGMAAYIVANLQGDNAERIAGALDRAGFWDAIREDPFRRQEWLEAVRRAPSVNPGRYTVLSTRDCVDEVADLIDRDERLAGCFV
jgi:glycerol-1-phosphate dehydrogenase [NAD(P)+]